MNCCKLWAVQCAGDTDHRSCGNVSKAKPYSSMMHTQNLLRFFQPSVGGEKACISPLGERKLRLSNSYTCRDVFNASSLPVCAERCVTPPQGVTEKLET
jgi:hypothetical protein